MSRRKRSGIRVDFFGAPALVSPAAARIALRTNAWVVPAVVLRGPDDDVVIRPMIDTGLRDFAPTGDEERDVYELTRLIMASHGARDPRSTRTSGSSSGGCGTTRRRSPLPRPGSRKRSDALRWLPRFSKWRYYLMWSVIQTIGRMPLRWRYGIAPIRQRPDLRLGAAHRHEHPQQHPPRARPGRLGRRGRPHQPPVRAQHGALLRRRRRHAPHGRAAVLRERPDPRRTRLRARGAGERAAASCWHRRTTPTRSSPCRGWRRPASRYSRSSSRWSRPSWAGSCAGCARCTGTSTSQ